MALRWHGGRNDYYSIKGTPIVVPYQLLTRASTHYVHTEMSVPCMSEVGLYRHHVKRSTIALALSEIMYSSTSQ
jgi:hypothetical protein